MKKSRPNPVAKQTYQTVKSFTSDGKSDSKDAKTVGGKEDSNNRATKLGSSHMDGYDSYLSNLETEIMGSHSQGKKSDLVEKNLNQMIDVLNIKMKSLENNAALRIKLCDDDLNANVTESSKMAPKLCDDLDDTMTKGDKSGKAQGGHRETLVATDNIYIDPVRLVIRSKLQTETAKKLEAKLEETFGVASNLDKGTKAKAGSVVMKNKKSEQQKNEAKKVLVFKLEKELQEGMETYITRSILDHALLFKAPKNLSLDQDPLETNRMSVDGTESLIFPITLKWPAADPRNSLRDNSDGQMNCEILLRYAIERVNITSVVGIIKWLIKQPTVQNYFVYMFWIMKLRFFQTSSEISDEQFLFKHISREYVSLINLMSCKSTAEHEKDMIYKYLPYVFATAIYYAFFYLCPSSRHLYTKGLRKTLYMQAVQVMYGFQLCPISVKVSWAKVFPEFQEDEEGDNIEVQESLPVNASLTSGMKILDKKRELLTTQAITLHHHHTSRENFHEISGALNHRSSSAPDLTSSLNRSNNNITNNLNRASSSRSLNNNNNNNKSNNINDKNNGNNYTSTNNLKLGTAEAKPTDRVIAALAKKKINPVPQDILNDVMGRLYAENPQNIGKNTTNNLHDFDFASKDLQSNFQDMDIGDIAFENSDMGPTPGGMLLSDVPEKNIGTRYGNRTASPGSLNKSRSSTVDSDFFDSDAKEKKGHPSVFVPSDSEIVKELLKTDPLFRTNLRAPLEKPKTLTQEVQRQNVEFIDGQAVSPMIQSFLDQPSQSGGGVQKQTLRRTVPISWCFAGGSETYTKRIVPKELHDEISVKASKVAKDFKYNSWLFHHRKMATSAKIDQMCELVLKSGATKMSRFSLDVVKSQGRNAKNSDQKTDLSESIAVETIDDITKAAQLDNNDIDEFIASL